MAIEYYVKRRLSNGRWKAVETCETSEQAVRQMKAYKSSNPSNDYIVVYSADALLAHERRTA